MKKEFIGLWIKSGIIRNRQRDTEKIKSMINSAEINAKVTKNINLNEDTATPIFREIYESGSLETQNGGFWVMNLQTTR